MTTDNQASYKTPSKIQVVNRSYAPTSTKGVSETTPLIQNLTPLKRTPLHNSNSPYMSYSTPTQPAIGGHGPTGNMDFWGAIGTILNMFLGLGVLSLPYAFSKGGFISLFCLLFVAFIGYTTAKFLIEVSKQCQQFTYGGCGFELGQEKGMYITLFIVCLELVGACLMTILFLWDNLFYLVGSHFFTLCFVSSVLVTPTVWLLNFSEMQMLNGVGVLSNVVFCGATVALVAFTDHSEPMEMKTPPFSDFSLALGIFLLCFGGHPCIPGVYQSMKEPQKFDKALKIAFLLMVLIYALVGFCGWYLYGEDTSALLTENMNVWPGGWISKLVTALITVRSYVTISPLLGLCAEMPETFIFGFDTPKSKRMFRTVLLWIFFFLAYLVRSHVDYVEAVTGSLVSIVTVFVIPPIFYLMAFKDKVSKSLKNTIYVLVVVSILAGLALTSQDVVNLALPQFKK